MSRPTSPFRSSTAALHETVPSFDAPGNDQYAWLQDNAQLVRAQVRTSGAAMIRGLPMRGPDDLGSARDALGTEIHTPREHFTQRHDFGNGIISAIPWADERPLCPFQESSFSQTSPSVVLVGCVTGPHGEGWHHLSDTRRLLDHLPAPLVDRVRAEGWVMTRVFHEGFGISWQDAFRVTDRAELEALLERDGVEVRWTPQGTLYTSRHRAGVIEHPETGDECWFNDLAFFNAGSLDPYERAVMTRAFGADLPVNTFFGGGSPVSERELAAVQAAYSSVKREIRWQAGDLLIADNVTTAQGRSELLGAPELLMAFGGEVHVGPQPDR